MYRGEVWTDSLQIFNEHYLAAAAAKSLQSCPTLCDPMDSSPPGSSVPGILQARILEWVAISFSTLSWGTGIKDDFNVSVDMKHGVLLFTKPYDKPGAS